MDRGLLSMETPMAKNILSATFCAACAAGTLALLGVAHAQDTAFVPETVSAKEKMDEGSNLFVNTQNWRGGPSAIYIYAAGDLKLKGSVSGGAQSHFAISSDGNTAYMVSGFYPRLASGEGEHILQIFDVPTNTLKTEIVLPYKVTQYTDDRALLQLSADERFLYVQNATPATSVTVVDLAKGEVIQEVPSPGCFGIYPTLEGYGYSVICNDGAFTTFALGEDGTTFESTKSDKIFDPDADPIYLASDRAKGDLLFVSYHGNVYRLSDRDGVIKTISVTPVAEGVEGNWGASGYSVVAYNDANDILFVSMAGDHHDGSHYHGATEVWAYDLENKALLYRSNVDDLNGIHVTDDAEPTLYGVSIGSSKVFMYDIDPTARFAAKKVAEHADFGFATTLTSSQ
jgi:methylamine dehydrogenase heavy chain